MLVNTADESTAQSCPYPVSAVEILVIGADERPLPDIAVHLLDATRTLRQTALTDRNGLVSFGGLDAETYLVSLHGQDQDTWAPHSSRSLTSSCSSPPGTWVAVGNDGDTGAVQITVAAGESTLSVATRHGRLPQAVWESNANQQLAAARRDMNALAPGDKLTIPALQGRYEPVTPGQCYVVQHFGIPAVYRQQILVGGAAIGRCPYLIRIDDTLVVDGWTDSTGTLEVFVPPQSRHGLLQVDTGGRLIELRLSFGTLLPVESDEGLLARLAYLGYVNHAGSSNSQRLASALRLFQRANGLAETGETDETTRTRLYDTAHKSGDFQVRDR